MPQWQFKLLEFTIREQLSIDKDEYVPGKDNRKFIIQMYGLNSEGKTASIFVRGYNPFFYILVGDDWTEQTVMEFQAYLKKEIGSYFEDSLKKCKLEKHNKLYGFDNKKKHNFVKISFSNINSFNKCKNLWFNTTNFGGNYEKSLKDEGLEFAGFKTRLYEAQIPPMLRMFHIREISPSGWIALKEGLFIRHKKTMTTCDYEFSVNYKNIFPINECEKSVPYKILSFDIEASSSHGDFPLAKKNYLKLSQEIVDYLLNKKLKCDENLLRNLIKISFGYAEKNYQISDIFIKGKITEEELDEKIDELIKIKPGLKENYLEPIVSEDEEEENEDTEITNIEVFEDKPFKKKRVSSHKNKDISLLDLLNDETCERNTKILELTKCFGQHNPNRGDNWEGIFPSIKGDMVTFIGSSFIKNGESKPYLNHLICLNECNDIDGIEIECYDKEKDVLIAWQKLIHRENPDIIIGYNIHGFDEAFMYKRSQELGCVLELSQLSRFKNEKCLKETWQGNNKPKKVGIEESSIKLASGQYDLMYYQISGRLQIDLLNLFRREEQLPSYKLDYVSGHFIGDFITKIEYRNLEKDVETVIYSKNLKGIYKDDYIVIEEIGHSTDVYMEGKKFKVLELGDDYFVCKDKLEPDLSKKLRWCIGKDDVTPQDIFRLTNEGPEGRAIVGKYCLKDCILVHDLLAKNDVMTGYVEMSGLCTVPMNFLVHRGQGIKLTSYVGKKCREKDTLIPVLKKPKNSGGYEGAIVLEPKCDLYLDDPVACVDYSSLYPSSIISENISHDTKVWTKEYDLDGNLLIETGEKDSNGEYIYDNLENRKYINITYDTYEYIRKTAKSAAVKTKSGTKTCRYVQPIDDLNRGILPSILEELLGERGRVKKQMKTTKDPFMYNVYDKRQLSIKITANSLYGQAGAETSTVYDKDVAASTTAVGRKLLIYAKTVIEAAYDNTIEDTSYGKVICKGEYIYGDTDSVFFTFNLKDLDGNKITGQKALEITIELAQKAGELATKNLKYPHDLEYEKTFLPFCLLSKKRYVGMLYELDPNKCKRKSMGIVLKRRDNAPIVKDCYGGVIDILMKEKSIQKSINFVKDMLEDVINEKITKNKLIITKSLRSYYKNPNQIAHCVLAKRMGERDPGTQPKAGDRMPYIYVKNPNKKALQGEKIEDPKYIEKENVPIDYGHYITNQIMKPLLQVFALKLEEMNEFSKLYGNEWSSRAKWKKKIEDLKLKWPEEEKFNKKYQEIREKEVKALLFDPYVKRLE